MNTQNKSQRGVCFGQVIVDLQSFLRRCLGQGKRILRRRCAKTRKKNVRITEPDIGQCIARIFLDRLFEIIDRFLKIRSGAFVPKISSLQI